MIYARLSLTSFSFISREIQRRRSVISAVSLRLGYSLLGSGERKKKRARKKKATIARLRRFNSPSRSRIRLDHVTRNALAARNNEAWGLGKIYRRAGKVGITDNVPSRVKYAKEKKTKKFLYVR